MWLGLGAGGFKVKRKKLLFSGIQSVGGQKAQQFRKELQKRATELQSILSLGTGLSHWTVISTCGLANQSWDK